MWWRCWADARAVRRTAAQNGQRAPQFRARREGVSCYRVYDADLPDYAVAIDVYPGAGDAEATCTCTRRARGTRRPPPSIPAAQRRYDDVLALAPVVWARAPTATYSRRCATAMAGGSQYRDSSWRSYVTQVREALSVRGRSGRLPGYRPVPRPSSHARAGGEEGRGRFNLFAHTGSASVQPVAALRALRRTVDSTDRPPAIWQPTAEGHFRTRRHDGVDLAAAPAAASTCGTAPVDPPSFSNPRLMACTWTCSATRALLIGVSRLLRKRARPCSCKSARSSSPTSKAGWASATPDITRRPFPTTSNATPVTIMLPGCARTQ